MSEISVGTWNAYNAFGDETFSEPRLLGAMEIVKHMDVDVLAIQEYARHDVHANGLEIARLKEVSELMRQQGYEGVATNYSNLTYVRDAHFMSLWSRIGGIAPNPDKHVRLNSQRHVLRLDLPDTGLEMYGVHFDDVSPEERVRSTKTLLRRRSLDNRDTVIMGDMNDMYTTDPRARIPRLVGKVVGNLEVSDYYDDSKRFQRVAGKVIRVCRMAEGKALTEFAAAGFHDADPLHQPTTGTGRFAFQIDHILGSPHITFDNFSVHPRSAHEGGEPISDHHPISAVIKR